MVLNKVKKIEGNSINFLSDNEIKKYLKWPLVYEAIEQALLSVVLSDDPNIHNNNNNTDKIINADENDQMATELILHLPKKTKTMTSNFGFLHSLSAYIGNYHLPLLSSITGNTKPLNTLACKLITCFNDNENNNNNDIINNNQLPLPNIMGNILLFNSNTGQVDQILEATEITAWRTAATSLVATKHLYFNRMVKTNGKLLTANLAIIGCSVQGRIHAIAMCTMFNIDEVHLWNRTALKAKQLQKELESMKKNFKNSNVKITTWKTIDECVPNGDIIVTATFSNECLIRASMIVKQTVHINAIGAGKRSHLCELDRKIYEKSVIYVDSLAEAYDDYKNGDIPINGGEIGNLIAVMVNAENRPHLQQSTGFTIFQPFGIAVEDAVVAQLVYEQYKCDINK